HRVLRRGRFLALVRGGQRLDVIHRVVVADVLQGVRDGLDQVGLLDGGHGDESMARTPYCAAARTRTQTCDLLAISCTAIGAEGSGVGSPGGATPVVRGDRRRRWGNPSSVRLDETLLRINRKAWRRRVVARARPNLCHQEEAQCSRNCIANPWPAASPCCSQAWAPPRVPPTCGGTSTWAWPLRTSPCTSP